MESTVLENFLVEVQGMKKNDARLKVIAELEAIKEEYKEYQDAGKYGLYTLDVSNDEMIRREIFIREVLKLLKELVIQIHRRICKVLRL